MIRASKEEPAETGGSFRVGSLAVITMLAIVIGGLLLVSEASRAQTASQEVLDANCQGPWAGAFGVVPTVTRAQTFTAINSGKLTSAQVELFQSFPASGDLTMEIRTVDASGTPTDTVLASSTIPSDQIPDAPPATTLTFNFDPASAATVVAGQQYALVLWTTAGEYDISVTQNPSCPGSAYSSEAGGPFIQSALDLIFAVFVTPDELPAPAPQPPAPQPPAPQTQVQPAPITQEAGQESESGGVDQSYEIS